MKSFLLKSLFLAFLAVVLFFLSYYYTCNAISNNKGFDIPESVHSVFLGHSHSACAFNDSIIDGFYNLSQPTEGYPYSYYKAKKILEANDHIEYLFLEYTNNQIKPWAYNRIYGEYLDINMPRMIPVLDNRFILKSFYQSSDMSKISKAVIKSYRSNLKFLVNGGANYLEHFWHDHITPSHVFDSDSSKIAVDYEKRFIDLYSVERENLNFLFKIKELCVQYNVQLIFTRSPLPKHVSFPNEQTFIDIKNSFFPNVPFLDFKNYPLGLKYFSDNQHLNRAGGVLFSQFFANSIGQEQVFNDAAVSKMIIDLKSQ